MKARAAIFFDFDSTIVTCEGLEEMVVDSLKKRQDATGLIEEARRITNLGMVGKLPFEESVKRRLALAPVTQSQFSEMGVRCLEELTPGFENLFSWLHEQEVDIYIVSGGFEDFIFPTAEKLGVSRANCIANSCHYSDSGVCIAPDESNPAWMGGGKHHVVEYLAKRDGLAGKKVMVGDSGGDLAAYENGATDIFIAFTANVHRAAVVERALHVAQSSAELQMILEKLFIKTGCTK